MSQGGRGTFRRGLGAAAAGMLLGGAAATLILWVSPPAASGEESPIPLPEGPRLYRLHCARCHGEEGEGRKVGNATAVNNQDFLTAASDEFLRISIARGRQGTEMPAWAKTHGGSLEDREVETIVAALRAWQTEPARTLPQRKTPGSPKKGARLYRENCASCHGRQGKGELGMGPALNNRDFLSVATDGFLFDAIARGRRDTPMFPSLKGLGGVRELSEDEIWDLVAFLRSWGKGR